MTTFFFCSAGILLPPFEATSKVFLGQILTKKKRVLLKKDVPVTQAPKWAELSLADLWPRVVNDSKVMQFFPDWEPGQKLPSRSFFWSVLFTLRGDWAEELVLEAAEKRQGFKPFKESKNSILNIGIAKEWADILLEQPFVSSKSQSEERWKTRDE